MLFHKTIGAFGLLPILLVLFVAETIAASVLFIAGDQRIFDIAFGFGPYIESFYSSGTLESCAGGVCRHVSRMPLVPVLYGLLAHVSESALTVAILKNLLLAAVLFACSGVLIRVQQQFHGGSVIRYWSVLALLLVLSPSVAKHAGAIDYEEGILTTLLFIWIPALLLTARLLMADTRNTPLANRVVIISVFSSLAAFLAKESMLLVFGLTLAVAISWAYLKRARNVAVACLVCGIVLGLWGTRNLEVSGRWTLVTSWSGENLFRGWNEEGARIYPQAYLDRLFDSSRIVLPDGDAIRVSAKPQLEPNVVGDRFKSEWEWNDYYRGLALSWGANNFDRALQFTLSKALVLFVYVEKYPLAAAADMPRELRENASSRSKRLERWAVGLWLGLGRTAQVAFAVCFALLLVRRQTPSSLVAIVALFALSAYAVPCLIGYSYERHVTPFLLVVISSVSFMMAEIRATPRLG